jgi:hypothetical protein
LPFPVPQQRTNNWRLAFPDGDAINFQRQDLGTLGDNCSPCAILRNPAAGSASHPKIIFAREIKRLLLVMN